MNKQKGFTLIEVLLALAVIAIALTALLKATSEDVALTDRIKEKTIRHWVAMQGIHMIQLGLLPIHSGQEVTQVTSMLGEQWYWRAKLLPTQIKKMEEIQITTSKNQTGPFHDPVIAFRYMS
ncbi:GspI family T2SS minor pseudopilin variant LspI [Legionella oakridgensis]|uniref:Type II secretion system protein I n=2 Tax=Legionella oakridgensis TaxID=29423 RepID=W0BBC6_9GAMM|nr:GspI family T2SS minor pseudopilin variant LspI [Legionella oakridgensis]AHE67165.1 general secretion pathway protein I [Legionella oakridgensis ATCC 33761 = DSM 21215]ETO93134.1 general secretion pathway protein I [Legionella oakridgensis RV-2-2007]KTD38030.1 type II secretory pathway protein LspI [Legionella oakridgensis]STY20248.1 general secretion pathway protein I [Legionella longbeachae]